MTTAFSSTIRVPAPVEEGLLLNLFLIFRNKQLTFF
jgi:hypothetical protein